VAILFDAPKMARMTTPQDSPRRKKQKIRRAKQLSAWRAANGDKPAPAAAKASTKS
jgi:hypothetical protein